MLTNACTKKRQKNRFRHTLSEVVGNESVAVINLNGCLLIGSGIVLAVTIVVVLFVCTGDWFLSLFLSLFSCSSSFVFTCSPDSSSYSEYNNSIQYITYIIYTYYPKNLSLHDIFQYEFQIDWHYIHEIHKYMHTYCDNYSLANNTHNVFPYTYTHCCLLTSVNIDTAS